MTSIRFARTWLRSPRSTGALSPSSEALAISLVAALPDDDYDLVIELGIGEGSVTRHLVARFGGERVFGVELDSGLAKLAAGKHRRRRSLSAMLAVFPSCCNAARPQAKRRWSHAYRGSQCHAPGTKCYVQFTR